MRFWTSDWHLIHDGDVEPCDRRLVRGFVRTAIERKVEEVILLGDIGDLKRGGRGAVADIARFLNQEVGGPLGEAGIYTSYVGGNHEGYGDDFHALAQALLHGGAFRPALFRVSTGPEVRGVWEGEHGSRFDPWCRQGSALTPVGEAFTRLDYVFDHVGLNLEELDPTGWTPGMQVAELDLPVHQAANRYACLFGKHLVFGHSHQASDLGGQACGRSWRALNCGALIKGHRLEFVWTEDDGQGGVEREFVLEGA